jgi:hypothetical protein
MKQVNKPTDLSPPLIHRNRVQRNTQLLLIDSIGATILSSERSRAREFGIPVMSYAQLIATYFYYVPTTATSF